MSIVVETHRDTNAFDALEAEWTELLGKSANDTFFLTPDFQRTWWRHLGEGELFLLTAREGDDLLGVAPLFATSESGGAVTLQTVGCVDVSDYLDWVTYQGREEEVLDAFLSFLAEPGDLSWDVIDLCNIHRDSPTLQILPGLAESKGWTTLVKVQEVCPVVDLPDNWDDYLAALRGKDRHELRRKTRRAEATEGIGWFIVGPEHQLADEVESYLELMAKSSPDKAEFLTPEMREFFRELCQFTFDAGWLQLSFLEVEDRRLASYISFVYNNRVLVYNSGLDWEADPGFGAGIVLTGYLVNYAIEEGRAEFDFMRGNERYKYRFGGQDVTVHRVEIRREN
jgi:CelD/BcsL family acetyltransferase involved in cellulose biosynthesis